MGNVFSKRVGWRRLTSQHLKKAQRWWCMLSDEEKSHALLLWSQLSSADQSLVKRECELAPWCVFRFSPDAQDTWAMWVCMQNALSILAREKRETAKAVWQSLTPEQRVEAKLARKAAKKAAKEMRKKKASKKEATDVVEIVGGDQAHLHALLSLIRDGKGVIAASLEDGLSGEAVRSRLEALRQGAWKLARDTLVSRYPWEQFPTSGTIWETLVQFLVGVLPLADASDTKLVVAVLVHFLDADVVKKYKHTWEEGSQVSNDARVYLREEDLQVLRCKWGALESQTLKAKLKTELSRWDSPVRRYGDGRLVRLSP